MQNPAYKTFEVGDHELKSGEILEGACIAYQTWGELNPDRSNAVIVPTHFGGTHDDSTYLFGNGRALDPSKYFIVVPNLMGNGLSSSPSNSANPALYPGTTIHDNVVLQQRLMAEEFRVEKLALAAGFSMGAVQAYHWAALFPERVERLGAICGSARISTHNYVFLEGMKAALTADSDWNNGNYQEPPMRGLRAMARAWSAWPPSAHFYREKLYEDLGFESVDDFLEGYWEAVYCGMDANNLLSQINAWQSADISDNELYRGDYEMALASIKAKAIVMPCVNDAYFPAEDSQYEVDKMTNAELRVIRSPWGHWAGSGRSGADLEFIDQNLGKLLAS